MPARYLHRNNFQRKDFVWHQWSRTLGQRIHHPGNGASSGAVRLLSGFSRLENSARKGDGRDGGSLRFLNPCCDQVLFAVAVPIDIDRTIQQAMTQQLTPIYEPRFSENSVGYRLGRGAKDVIQKIKKYAEQGYTQAVILDLSKYFDTLNHTTLLNLLRKEIKDERVIQMIKNYLKSGVMENGGKFSSGGQYFSAFRECVSK